MRDFSRFLRSISRTVLAARYSLLNYYHTLFYRANTQGGTVVRPLFFEFPGDANTIMLDRQILVRNAFSRQLECEN